MLTNLHSLFFAKDFIAGFSTTERVKSFKSHPSRIIVNSFTVVIVCKSRYITFVCYDCISAINAYEIGEYSEVKIFAEKSVMS
jgi:hypothetical protein